ncbi:N-acyl-D-amino-acid deacylase family protein [Scopulibacillus cellulosilyticus]|uniref:Amidohydrolase family protein n=1 Tax=Scopulibacillus cellulosilyticus TaxID=2665665 RepID=A0ABW2Q1P7_9BACL
MYDLVIKNGKVVDGTGNPWFNADVGIKDNKIVRIGKIDNKGHKILDAKGKFVSPGFIDGHCHSDLMILDFPESEIKLRQGVTTEVVGNCGLAPAPVKNKYKELLEVYTQPVLGKSYCEWKWNTVEEYFNVLDQNLASSHTASYVAHGAVRIAVMGFDKRQPTKQEMDEMKQIVDDAMRAGAIGLSIGLLYAPSCYASKEELVELCKVAAKYDGIFATHVRGEGNNLLSSIKDVIWIAEKAGISLHISHLKAAGKRNWGLVMQAMELIEASRCRGMDIACDVYPYNASSTMLTTLLPPWSLEGGMGDTLKRLQDKTDREKIIGELSEEREDWDNLVYSTGWENVVISSVTSDKMKQYEGKNVKEIGQLNGKDPINQALDLLVEAEGNLGIVYYIMNEEDVREVIRYPKSLIASDSLTCYTGKPHPRLYGTFPRVIKRYVKDTNILTLEDAIRKMTSFPAKRFRLNNKGLLLEGYEADITIFDYDKVADLATYENPMTLPEGIEHVVVNGQLTIENEKHNHKKAGHFIPFHSVKCACH